MTAVLQGWPPQRAEVVSWTNRTIGTAPLIRPATALTTKGEIPDDVDYKEWLAAWRPRA